VTVAQIEHLVETVGDEDQRPAFVAQAAGDREESIDLHSTERGRRLVHDQQSGVERDGLRDLDDLLVGDGQTQRRAPGVDVHAKPVEQPLSLGVHRRAVDPPSRGQRLAPHEDVLGDREVREEGGLLVDHRHACCLGLGGRGEVDGLTSEAKLARVAAVDAGHDLDQRGLASAVLADEGVDRTRVHRDGCGAQCDDGAERLRHVTQFERGCARHV